MKTPGKIIVVLSMTAVLSCRTTALPTPSAWLQYASPADAGFDGAAIEEAYALANRAGSAAVMAIVDGRVLVAWGDVERKLELHSVRKSIYSALWGMANERRLVKLDATVGELGIDDLQALTVQEKRAMVIDLLRARSGIYHPAAYTAVDDAASRPDRGAHAPGTFWFYNNWDFNIAGALLERLSGRPLGALFDEWIAQPVGMEDYDAGDVFAVLEPRTSRWPALTFRMSTRDLARFGQLWLDRGAWNGRQIVPAEWVARASMSASATGTPGQGYAMMWWTYDRGAINAERYPAASRYEILQARGTGGQALYVIPAAKMVVVHRGDTDHGRAVGGRDVWTIVDRLLAARRTDPAERPRLTELRPEPLEGQVPPMEWPPPLSLATTALERLTGRYEIAPGVHAHVYMHEGRLFASMPGEGEAELFARSPSDFYLRVEPGVKVRFDLHESGPAPSVRVTIRGREIVGRRVNDY